MSDSAGIRSCLLLELSKQKYSETHDLQLQILQAKRSRRLGSDVVILVEHYPVYTLGKRGGKDSILVPDKTLRDNNISVQHIERGGDVTYHGPGQLVLYPILDLRKAKLRVPDFVWALEEIMIQTAGIAGIEANRDLNNRGVWVQNKKLGSVGIAIRYGISFHGLAFNVNPWLEPFSWINPCGLRDVEITSLAKERGWAPDIWELRSQMLQSLRKVLDIGLERIELQNLLKYMDKTNGYNQ